MTDQLTNANYVEDPQTLAARMSFALRTTASVLNSSLNLDEVLHLILQSLGNVLPHDVANIMLIENNVARVKACKGYESRGGTERVLGFICNIEKIPNLVRMVKTGQPIVISDTYNSPDWVIFENSSWVRSYASTPIRLQGRTIGFINLNSCISGLYTSAHADHLLAFADQAAVAIHNARLFEAAQKEIAERKSVEATLQKTLNELEMRVEQRTLQLREANDRLVRELELRREAEHALEMEHELLAQRVEERTAELSSANAELARAAQLKDNFISSMSHELRTPLNAILNISETLLEQVYGELNEKQVRLARTIEESGRHLLALINDILDLSKIGAGKMELLEDDVQVTSVCDASLKMVREAAQKKNQLISVNIDPTVSVIRADHRRLKQILVNLLNNAVKFTPAGGTLGLDVVGDREHQQAHFTVWDNGIGIAKENLKLLFKSFTQLDNGLSRQFEGTGLGLALVYHLVELHGGGIRVESEEGAGSRFTFTLQWSPPEEIKQPLLPQTDFLSADAQTTLDPASLTTRYLNSLGIELKTFWSEDRLSLLPSLKAGSDGRPAVGLVVIDISFSGMESELIRNLWRDGLPQTNPILIITNGSMPPNEELHRLPSNVQTLAYPFTRQDMRAALQKMQARGTGNLLSRATLIRRKETPITNKKIAATVLVVDDNAVYTRMLSDYLEYKGIHPILAYDGSDAIARANESIPDLILMDIQMPGLDGLETIRRIRQHPPTQNIPIVALTALAMPEDRVRCIEAGANDYISKPLPLKTVWAMVSKYLNLGD